MKAIKEMIFGVYRRHVGVERVAVPLKGFAVNTFPVVELIIREQRLHGLSSPLLQLVIKIDGRSFWGNN